MPLTSYALTELDTALSEVGATSAQNTLVTRLINAVSRAMSKEAGRPFHYQTGIVERVPGFGGYRLLVERRPVLTLTSIELLAMDGTVADTYETDSYEIEDASLGFIYRELGWPDTARATAGFSGGIVPGSERKSLRVTYTAGYITPFQASVSGGSLGTRTLPEDLEEACLWSVVDLYSRRGHSRNQGSVSDGKQSTNYRNTTGGILTPETIQVVRKFKDLAE